MNTFADMMLYLRKKYGASQRIVAEGSGFDKSFISRLESGDREPTSREMILRLAEGIGASPEDSDKLLLTAGYMPVQAQAMLNNPELARLDDLMATATDDRKTWAKNAISDVIAVLKMGMKDQYAATAG